MSPYWQMVLIRAGICLMLLPSLVFAVTWLNDYMDKKDNRYDLSFIQNDPQANAIYAGFRYGFTFLGLSILAGKCLELLFL